MVITASKSSIFDALKVFYCIFYTKIAIRNGFQPFQKVVSLLRSKNYNNLFFRASKTLLFGIVKKQFLIVILDAVTSFKVTNFFKPKLT